ncbi:MAG: hypothetical protein WD069_21915 [Planctomycetales bacterium]
MRKTRTIFAGHVAVVALILLDVVIAPGSDDSRQPAALDTLFEESENIVQQRELRCKQLLAILADPENSAGDRITAAKLLGQLKCEAAIPALLQHIELQRPFDAETSPPLAAVLAQFGDAAMPEIISACLEEDRFVINGGALKGRSVLPYLHAIREGRMIESAHVYCVGLGAIHANDPERVRKIKGLVARLEKLRN